MARSKISLFGIMAMGCALALAACTPATVATGGPAPPGTSAPVDAPPGKLALLAGTHVDDEAIRTATATMRETVSVLAALRAGGIVQPGTPGALASANGLAAVRRWMNADHGAQQSGETATERKSHREGTRGLERY